LALVAMLGGHAAIAGSSDVGGDGYIHVAPNGTVLGVDPYYPKDGNGGYDVQDYALTLDYDPGYLLLRGRATVKAAATQDLARFNLDLYGFTVYSVTVDGKSAAFTRAGAHEVVITPSATLSAGSAFTAEIAYVGRPRTLGSGRGTTGWLATPGGPAVAAGMPHSAMTWFPVNGTEVDKATMRVAVTVPVGWSVVGNGVLRSDVPCGTRHTVTWAEETAMAPNAAMLGIGRWQIDTVPLPGGPTVVNAYAPGATDKREVGDRLPEVLGFLTGVLGDYPQSAAGGLFLDRSLDYTHPAQTRPVYGSSAGVTDLVYATAYQWWGNGVTHKMWRDVLMPESFARYAVWLWDEAKSGVDLDDRYRALVTGAGSGFWTPKLTDPGAGAEYAPTAKAVLMVHALRRTIGDDAFSQVLSGFPAINPQGNQNWHDFELYVEAVAQRDLAGFNHAWTEATVIPADEFLHPGTLRP
jgi:aminopeptidase N